VAPAKIYVKSDPETLVVRDWGAAVVHKSAQRTKARLAGKDRGLFLRITSGIKASVRRSMMTRRTLYFREARLAFTRPRILARATYKNRNKVAGDQWYVSQSDRSRTRFKGSIPNDCLPPALPHLLRPALPPLCLLTATFVQIGIRLRRNTKIADIGGVPDLACWSYLAICRA